MKTIKLYFIILFAFSASVNSQITKGNWMVGGTGYFNTIKYKNDTIEQTINHFTLSPNIGYFIINKFVIGCNLNYSSDDVKYADVKFTNYNIGPYLRYYFLKSENRINLFSQISYGYGEGKASNNRDSKYHNNGYGLRIGSSIFFNSSVALEIAADYNSSKNNSVANVSLLQFGLGFQIHLEK